MKDAVPCCRWPPVAGSPFALRVGAAEPCLRETLVVVAGAAAGGLAPPAEEGGVEGGGHCRCRCGTFRVELHDRFRNRCIGAKAMRLLQIEVCVGGLGGRGGGTL